MKKFVYFIRHGESEGNLTATHSGQLDTPLTDRGRAQAAASAAQLEGVHFDTVFCSDLSRAVETAKIMIPNADYRYMKELREVNVGILAGQTRAVCREAYGEAYKKALLERDYTAFNGESHADFSARVAAFLQFLAEGDFGEHIAVVGHRAGIDTVFDKVVNQVIHLCRTVQKAVFRV